MQTVASPTSSVHYAFSAGAQYGYVATLLVEDWAQSERCKSCSDVCLKGRHGQSRGCY